MKAEWDGSAGDAGYSAVPARVDTGEAVGVLKRIEPPAPGTRASCSFAAWEVSIPAGGPVQIVVRALGDATTLDSPPAAASVVQRIVATETNSGDDGAVRVDRGALAVGWQRDPAAVGGYLVDAAQAGGTAPVIAPKTIPQVAEGASPAATIGEADWNAVSGGSYQARVALLGDGLSMLDGPPTAASPAVARLAPPSGLATAVDPQVHGLSISWAADPDAQGYEIRVVDAASGAALSPTAALPGAPGGQAPGYLFAPSEVAGSGPGGMAVRVRSLGDDAHLDSGEASGAVGVARLAPPSQPVQQVDPASRALAASWADDPFAASYSARVVDASNAGPASAPKPVARPAEGQSPSCSFADGEILGASAGPFLVKVVSISDGSKLDSVPAPAAPPVARRLPPDAATEGVDPTTREIVATWPLAPARARPASPG